MNNIVLCFYNLAIKVSYFTLWSQIYFLISYFGHKSVLCCQIWFLDFCILIISSLLFYRMTFSTLYFVKFHFCSLNLNNDNFHPFNFLYISVFTGLVPRLLYVTKSGPPENRAHKKIKQLVIVLSFFVTRT